MDREDWKDLFAPRILQRGLAYYREGAVKMLQREGDVVKAVVLGSERYRVEIGLKGDEIAGWSCDCPYASKGAPCKHLAAVFYGLVDDDREEASDPRAGQASIRELIEEMDLEQAHALLLRLAERDTAGADQIQPATESPSKQQIQHWKKRIDRLLSRAAGRYGYIEYDWAWNTICELDDFLSDTAGQLLVSGYVWEAFSLTGYGFQAAAQCDMDASDGGLTMLAETCLGLWSAQIDGAGPELRRRMYQWFQEACQTSDSLCQALLWEAQQKLFHDPEFLQANIVQLDRMIQEEQASRDRGYSQLPRLVIQKLFEKVIKTNLGTINEIIDTVFPQVSTSFTLNEIIGLASGMTKYELGDSAGFPFDKTDGISYQSAGSVVVPVGLAENVEQLHEFLYPKEEQTGVSETVEQISQDISYITGVIRTPEYDEEPEETQGEEEPEDDGSTPVITDVSQSQTGENETQE